jgi:D-alanyl-D-alanine-carboxypeptidase/D-alanyl-D-alanine-endopeptidase
MRKVWSLITVLVVLSMLTGACAAPKPSRLPDPEEVKALLVQLVDVEKRAPGIVVGMIAADPEERWVVGYGRLSATDQRVPDGDTVFELASIGKLFTGTLLAQAVVNGEVQLDDPISMYLPEGVNAPAYEGRSITLLDLATHTSGLPWGDIKPMDSSYTLDQMYGFLSGYRLTRAPGSQYEYSTFGFGLLGNLLVRRAGVADYEALLEERITGPLGMVSTHIGLTPEMRSRLAPPHANYSYPAPSLDAPTFAGAGAGLRTTANDMLKFLAANMGLTGTELQPAIRLANTPQRPDDKYGYIGLGWGLSKSGKGGHGHIGGNPGYSTYLIYDTERKIGLVVLSNSASSIDDVIGLQLLRGLPKPFPVDPQVLAAYAGRYQLSDGQFVTIRVNGGHIFLQIPNQGEFELVARSNNQFYPQEFDAELTFYRNESGEVDRGVLLQFGVTYEAKKVP